MPPTDWFNFGHKGGKTPDPEETADTPAAEPYVRPGYEATGGRPTFADAGAGLFRNDKTESWKDVVGDILDFGSGYVDWLSSEEESRGQAAEDIIRKGAERFNTPSMTDADIQRQFGAGADEAARGYNANLKNLRATMGGAGVTGGARAQGQAINFEAQRQRILTDTRRSLYEKQVQTDMMDRSQRFSAEMALAQQVGRDPSVATMDWLGTGANASMGLFGIESQRDAARNAANAQKKAGKASGAAGIIDAVVPG